jgi:hypothetical protein
MGYPAGSRKKSLTCIKGVNSSVEARTSAAGVDWRWVILIA